MAQHPNRTAPELQALLNGWFVPAAPANTPDFVIVADIGQGNLNAVFNQLGQPFLYYDFGGGIDGSLFTYPDPAPVLCLHAAPNFILSHWDSDHVKSIRRLAAGDIVGTHWLAPTQEMNGHGRQLGLSKRAKSLRKKLRDNGDIYLWPDDPAAGPQAVASVTASFFTVIKVNGNDMNNHGLAIRINDPAGVAPLDAMLLTGDAGFQAGTFTHAIHACTAANTIGLVTSHHGAEITTQADVPGVFPVGAAAPAVLGRHTVAYSFGWGNAYGHPSTTGVAAYALQGWRDEWRADTGGSEMAADLGGPRGNIALTWRAPGPGLAAEQFGAAAAAHRTAAVQLVAAASREAHAAAPASTGHAAAAAAHEAAVQWHAAQVPPIAGASGVAAAIAAVAGGGGGASQLAADAAALGALDAGAAPGFAAPHAAGNAAGHVALRVLADAVATIIMAGGFVAAQRITAAAAGAAGVGTIGSQARVASYAAYQETLAAGFSPAVRGACAPAPVVTAAGAYGAAIVGGGGVVPALTNANVLNMVEAAIQLAAQHMIGHTRRGFLNIQHGKSPPAVATATLIAAQTPPGWDRLAAAIVAAAALMPAFMINPEAGAPAVPGANPYATQVARAAAVGAIVGVRFGDGVQVAAAAAVAAARIASPAVRGGPLPACRRHPNGCGAGASCALGAHYVAL